MNIGQEKTRVHDLLDPELDHNFIRMGPAPPTPPSLPGLAVRMGPLPYWEPV